MEGCCLMGQIPFGVRLPRGFRSNLQAFIGTTREPADKPTELTIPQQGPCPICGVAFRRLRKHYPSCKAKHGNEI
jgi:hypothetical protein